MNLNYDLVTWIDYFIGAFACCVSIFMSGKFLLGKVWKDIKYYNVLLLILCTIFLIFNSLLFENIMKIFGTLAVFVCIYKFSLNTKIKDSFVMAIATCVVFLLGEATTALLISLIDLIFKTGISNNTSNSYVINIAIAIFSYIYAILLKKIIINSVNKISKNSKLPFILTGIVTIFIVVSSFYKFSLDNWTFNYSFVLNFIIIVGSICLFWILLTQYIKNKEMSDKYILLKDYLQTSAELIEKYSSTVHKYKNNLIAIKGYIKADNKKAESYIDDLLETYEFKKYKWINKINNIKIDAVRYLIYYKLSKAENNNLNIIVDVSKDMNNYDNYLSIHDINILLDIIGELFDNAIYASCESKEKEFNIYIYEEDRNIKFVLSNTYVGLIDLSIINKNGYTTKGEGHGLGLYDIDKTIKKNNKFKIKYEIIDNYFTVTLMVNVK